MNHATRFTKVCASQFTGICDYLTPQKKHALTHFATWLQLLLLGGDAAENRERVVEGRKYFPLI